MSAVITLAAVIGGFLLFALYKVFKTTKKKSRLLEFVGQVATTIDELGPGRDGFVRFHGEHWKARSSTPVASGQKVRIVGREGLLLFVEPITGQ